MKCPKTCASAPNIEITQELLDRDSLPWSEAIQFTQHIGEKRTIDGKDVAVVFAKNIHDDHFSPFLKCACDFHYEEQEHCRMHYIDAHSCKRKTAWYRECWNEIALEYNNRGMSPKAIILDIFDRVVNKGAFLGQTQGDWIYVQNIAEVFLLLDPKVWGEEEYPLQIGSTLFKRLCAQGLMTAEAVNKNRPPESHWRPQVPTIKELAFTHALDIVRTLIDEKKLSLNGMVLTPYVEPPPKVLDETRTPMLSWEAKIDPATPMPRMLVWMTRLKKRFHAEVQRVDQGSAMLCLFCHGRRGKPDRLVKTWKVGLSYGAQFGPDVSDVHTWQETIKKFLYAELTCRTPAAKGTPKK
jgi:hypothetical protein